MTIDLDYPAIGSITVNNLPFVDVLAAMCQSASNLAPGSASNVDPTWGMLVPALSGERMSGAKERGGQSRAAVRRGS
jgi:hypothetical protein